ncbi:hypothetical protein ACGK9U_14720 [Mariniflexile sp. HNIBRBA6329]|uniref:hypothetical protein n=1 Tax=Mariniflexile sp. HNIBRBA6329 TaxID=3373088 RepID=UPI0037454F80
MKLETAEDFLKKFDYNYEKRDKALIIDMEFSQKVLVDFSNPESVVMTNKLKGWNFLTGIIPSSIKNAVFLNLALGIILSLLISLYDTQAGVFFFLGLMFWILVWFTFYHSKFNNLQQFLMKWMN